MDATMLSLVGCIIAFALLMILIMKNLHILIVALVCVTVVSLFSGMNLYEDGGRLYSSQITEEAFSAETDAVTNYNKDKDGNPLIALYGADDFLLNSMDVIEGEIDWEALKTGNYTLYALTMDDNGNIIDNPSIHVGDKITFHHWKMDGLVGTLDNSFDLTVMAKVLINENTDTERNTGAARFYLPTEQFKPLCINPRLVSFPFNVKDGADSDMNSFLSNYVENIEPSMNYESKETYVQSFNIVQAITSSFWFFTYHFVIWPMLVVYPFLILLTAIIPAILYREFAKSSIIERLHQN